MRVIETVSAMKAYSKDHPGCGFVPTMGALHAGHLSLINKSTSQNKVTVVSLFVNKTQFNNPEDFEKYPSTLKEDLTLLKQAGVQAAFLPTYEELYQDGYRYKLVETTESLMLCGKDRPGHFDGVLSVVLKLFQIVKPSFAYFGEKDFQQVQLIKGMVQAFFMDLTIVACPVVRDSQGLALSSRNVHLSEQGLEKAQFFAQTLAQQDDFGKLKEQLESQDIEIDYLEKWKGRKLAAVKIEGVRLIDNVEL